MKTILRIIILILCIPFCVMAQHSIHNTARFKCYNTDNALSYNNIQSLQVDNSGILWISHAHSIWSFDGKNAVQHLPSLSIPGSDKVNNIHTIMMDKQGYLWGISSQGIVFYYRKELLKEPIFKIFNLADIIHQPVVGVSSLVEDSKGNKWILAERKLFYFSNMEFVRSFDVVVSDKNTALIAGDDEVIIYSGLSSEADIVNLSNQTISHKILPAQEATNLIGFRSDNLNSSRFIYGWNYLARIDAENHKAIHYFNYLFGNSIKDPINIISASATREYIFVGTSNAGLFIINRKTKKILHLMNRPEQSFSLPQNQVGCMTTDGDKNVFIGTSGSGLAVLTTATLKFGFSARSRLYESINDNKVFSFFEDTASNSILIGTLSRGLNILDCKSGKFSYVPSRDVLNPEVFYPLIYTMSKDPSTGLFWLGCSGALFTYKMGDKVFVRKSPSNALGNDYDYLALHHLNDDTLLVGTLYYGLHVINKKTGKYGKYPGLENLDASIYQIRKEGENIWITSKNEMYVFERMVSRDILF